MFDHVPLWLCEDITACCYMYCYFRNNLWREALEQGSMDMFPLASAASQAARERAVYAEHL